MIYLVKATQRVPTRVPDHTERIVIFIQLSQLNPIISVQIKVMTVRLLSHNFPTSTHMTRFNQL